MDWDLESPGLGMFFQRYLDQHSWQEKQGVLDLMVHQSDNALFSFSRPDWRNFIIP